MKDKKLSFGIDLNSRKVLLLLVSDGGEIISDQSIYAEVYRGEDYIVGKLAEAMNKMIRKCGADRDSVVGAGIAVPVVREGSSVTPQHFEGWDTGVIANNLAAATGFKTELLNYGTATGFAEVLKSGLEKQCILSIDIFETLISAGFIVDGKIPKELSGMNIGHMIIDSNGFKCSCGRKGCLTAMATSVGIIKYYQAFAKQRTSFANWKKAVVSNDLAADYALDKCAAAIALGISNVLKITNADSVILGGDLMLGIHGLFEKVVECLQESEEVLPEIRKSSAGDSGEAFGAAAFVHANILN